jgi:CHAD domain-containing protein
LPLKVARAAKRQLRGIRRAAGDARDWDVLVARLLEGAEATSGNDRSGVDLMVGYAMAHRIPAQRQLETTSPNYPFGFERFMAETVGTIREPRSGEASLIEFARPMLAHLANALDHSLIERQATDYERLHDVRLAGKRLRYALEIFVDCFGPSLRQVVCPALADLQQILGEVNDHCTAGQRYSALERGMQRCLSSGNGRYASWLSRQIHQHSERMVAAGQQFAVWRERWQSVETRTALADIQPPVALRRLPELSMPIRFDGAPSASVAFVATPAMESIA